MMDIEAQAPLFEAVIVPHRSLSEPALRRLLLAIGLMCCASTGVFVWLGAWPVGGFAGIELLLAAVLFRISARAVRGSEIVMLTESGLRVVRTEPNGTRRELTLPTAWLTLMIEERQGRVPGLLLVARQMRVEIGRSLGEAEKRDLAGALGAALERLHRPIFDNPQLRED